MNYKKDKFISNLNNEDFQIASVSNNIQVLDDIFKIITNDVRQHFVQPEQISHVDDIPPFYRKQWRSIVAELPIDFSTIYFSNTDKENREREGIADDLYFVENELNIRTQVYVHNYDRLNYMFINKIEHEPFITQNKIKQINKLF